MRDQIVIREIHVLTSVQDIFSMVGNNIFLFEMCSMIKPKRKFYQGIDSNQSMGRTLILLFDFLGKVFF